LDFYSGFYAKSQQFDFQGQDVDFYSKKISEFKALLGNTFQIEFPNYASKLRQSIENVITLLNLEIKGRPLTLLGFKVGMGFVLVRGIASILLCSFIIMNMFRKMDQLLLQIILLRKDRKREKLSNERKSLKESLGSIRERRKIIMHRRCTFRKMGKENLEKDQLLLQIMLTRKDMKRGNLNRGRKNRKGNLKSIG